MRRIRNFVEANLVERTGIALLLCKKQSGAVPTFPVDADPPEDPISPDAVAIVLRIASHKKGSRTM